MAVTSSAPISITDLVTEFGGSAPHSLTEYYRGGSLVPNVTANNSVPTSGAISLTDFFGAVKETNSDTRTISPIGSGSFGGFITGFGFSSAATGFPIGGMGSPTIEFDGFNVTIEALYFLINGITFRASTNPGNSGWTSMTIGSTTLNRADATYNGGGTINSWTWTSSNIIGTSGTQTVFWTE
jgi:hypothetical protein